jgi:predicted GNAT family acetyltransferase
MEITQRKGNNKGAFLAKDNDSIIGEMTYVWSGLDTMIIDHIVINPDYRGQGIGALMVEKAVDYARKNHISIIPLCSYVRSVFARNPAYNDVVK